MKSRPTSAVRLSAVALICLSATALAAGWSPGEWIGQTPLGRALVARASAPRFGLGGSPAAAIVTANKTGVLLNDVDGDGKADPGDTIRYTVAVSADASAAATGVHLADALDANTTLVPGSIAITPQTTDDAYLSVGNVTLTSAAIAADCATNPLRSVTCNDVLYGATVVGFGPLQASANGTVANGVNTVTTGSGGKVALATDGTFVYEPSAGYEGADVFWYTVSNSAGTAVAKATVTVGSANAVNQTNKMVWFVSVAGGGTGTQARPMTLAALAAINNGSGSNPANGDTVYLLEGTHASGFSLRADQKLIGQDATVSVATLGGPAPSPGNVYPALNPTAAVVNTNSISLNSGNTIAGFTAGNSSTAMSGSSSGTLSVREVVLNGNSRGLTLTSATAVTDATFTGFTSVSSASGTTGIQLSAVNGALNLGGGQLNANTGVAFVVVGGNATITYAGTIQNSGSRQVSISNKTGGAVNFAGLIGGTGTGIFLDNNDLGSPGVAEITFSGGMGTVALTATNGGIVNVCDRNPCGTGSAVVNTLSSPTATVLNVTGTSIGANGVTFRSLTSGNSGSSIATGITLSGTGTLGGLTVTGTGTPGSGGTIQRKTGADSTVTQGTGISLVNTAGVSLAWMQLNDFSNHAIRGTNVTGLTLRNIVINGANGTTTTGQREGEVHIDGLFTTGTFAAAQTASIANSIIGGTAVTDSSLTDHLRIVNTSGTLDRLTITNTSFGILGSSGINGVEINAQNAAIMKVTVTDSFFTSARTALLHATAATSGTLDVVARRNTMSNNNSGAAGASGLVIDGDVAGTASIVGYDVSCNAISGSGAPAVAILKGNGSGAWSGSIVNNTIGVAGVPNSGSTLASGIKVASNGTGSQTVMIADNRVHQTNRSGIWLTAGDSQLGSNPGWGVMNATLFHNVADEPGSASIAGLSIDGGTVSTDTNVVNVVVGASSGIQQNDFSAGDFSATRDVTTTGTAGGVINLSRNGSASGTAGGVITDDNLNPATTSTSIAGTVNLVSSVPLTPPAVASCTQVAGLETPATTERPVLARADTGVDTAPVALAASQPATGSRIAMLGTQVRLVAADVQAALLTTVARSTAAVQTGASAVWSGMRSLAAIVENALVARLEARTPPEVDVDLGTVPAGGTISVVFAVTVNAAPVAQYLNEATVSGTNFSDVLTNTVTTPGDRFDTVTTLTSSPNPAGTGVSVTFTATVTPSAGAITPDGTVQFMDGASPFGTAVTCVDAGSNTCAAALTTTTLTGGTHSVTAVYGGGTNHDASTSGPVSQVIALCTTNPVVTTGADAGAGSLRQALADACAGDTVTFSGAVSAVDLTSDQLTIDKDLKISGPGANLLTVQRASGAFRIFSINMGTTVTISGLTIAGGSVAAASTYPANAGGAIYNDHGTLTISGSAISGNDAASGGGIFNDGTTGAVSLTIVDSTLSGNSATVDGGAVTSRGVSGGTATATVTNSTISGNTANGNGGGVYNLGSTAASAALTITGSTVTNNHADQDTSGAGTGGGVATVTSTAVVLRNTIVAGNHAGAATTTADDVSGGLDVTSASNLIGVDTGMTGVTTGVNGNQAGTAIAPIDARLGALAINGGRTLTHALRAGSPALDSGDNALAIGSTDQRGAGFGRILDAADTNTTQTVDIGAFEADPSVEDIADQVTNEDTPLVFTFNVGDSASAFGEINASSSNTTLVPNASAVVSADTASTRLLTLTPAAGQAGTTTITVTVNKTVGGTPLSMTDTFAVTVMPIADTPSVTSATTVANVQTTSGLVISLNPADGGEVGFFKISGITGGVLYQNNGTTAIADNAFITVAQGNAGLKFTPATDSTAPGSFQVQASLDAIGTGLSSGAATATITVNKHATTTTIVTDNQDPSDVSVPVTVAYTVVSADGGPAPSGTVTVTISGGSETCSGTVAAGQCVITLTVAGVNRTLTASYGGDALHAISSDTELHTVTSCPAAPVVTDPGDSGPGTLRQAIVDACATDTIGFSLGAGPHTIDLTSGELLLDKNLTITGPGANLLTVQRTSGTFRIFHVAPGKTVTIGGLTMAGGLASEGGGVKNSHGTLAIVDSAISGNTATSGQGGAIFNDGNAASASLTLVNTTVSGNQASSYGGAVYNVGFGGGTAALTITNSTLSGNTAAVRGGGVYSEDNDGAHAPVTITNSTITNNRGTAAAGGLASGGGSPITLRNTIVAGNVSGASPSAAPDDVAAGLDPLTSFNNLIGVAIDPTGLTNGTNGNQLGTAGSPIDARLGALANNGGPTLTHALLAGSPALDTGDNTFVAAPPFLNTSPITDQRGATFARVRDAADANTTPTVDIGAFEADPSVEAIADQATNEDTPLIFTFYVGDSASAFSSISAASSNTALVPNASAVVSADTASTRTLTLTPALNQAGTTTITVTATKTAGGSMSDTFVLTVNAVNDPPTLDPIADPAAILEDAALQTINLGGISAGGGESQALTVTASSNNTALIPNPTVSYTSRNATGSLSYAPVAAASGSAIITVTVTDAGGGTNAFSRTFTVNVTAVNDAPTLDAIADPAAILEDAALQTVNLSGITAGGGETQTLAVTATSNNTALIPNPTVSYTSPSAAGSLSYTPVANANGSAIITVTVTDSGGGTNTVSRTFTVSVTAVNDAPTLDAIANPAAILEDAGLQTVTLTGITAGAGESQTLTATASSNNTGLIPNPTVSYTSPNPGGSLSYTPVANASGSAIVTVTVTDNGGGTNTVSRTFTVNVTAVNDAPTLDPVADPAAILEDAGLQTVNLSGIGAGGGETQTVTVTATSSNTAVIPNPTVGYTSPNATGSLSYTPVPNANGSAIVTVTVTDSGGGTNTVSRTFTVNVTAVNDAPTLDAIANPAAMLEDATLQTVNLAGITAGSGETQTLTVTATSNNAALIPNPTVGYTSPNATGSLSYTPVANANGSAVITVTVTDTGGGTNTFSRTFTVNVTAVNDAPTLDAIANPAAILEDAALQTVTLTGIAAGAGEGQTLTVTASSNNTGLIPNPAVSYTSANPGGSLSYTPVADANGAAIITVTVTDDGGGTNTFSRTFTVNVTAVNDAPTLDAIANPAAMLEDAPLQTVSLSGITAGGGETQTLTVTAASNNTALIPSPTVSYTSANPGGSLSYTPVANANGSATITVTVTDNGTGTNTVQRTFTVAVTAVDDPPTLDAIPDPAAILEDAGLQTINLSGITAGGTGESQPLTVSASSNNTALIPNPSVSYTSANATASLTYTPVADANGSAVITVTVGDGVNTFQRTFTIAVTAVNDAPTLDAIADPAAILEDAALQTVTLTGITAGPGESQTLTVTATSNNTSVIPNPTVGYTSANTTGSLSYTAVANANGSATITVTVTDSGGGTNTFSRTFTVTVTPVDDAPTLNAIPDPAAILEDAGLQTIDLSGINAGGGETQTLTVTATSNNTAVIPNPAVSYTSPNATGSLTYTPAANANGSAVITVTVGDGVFTVQRTFTVAVTAVNDAPTILAIAGQSTSEDIPTGAIAVTVGDVETPAGSLTMSGSSSNTTLIPNGNLAFGGSGGSRTLTITPAANQFGASTITVSVNDGTTSTSTTFLLTVTAVNDAPTISAIASQTTPQNTPTAALGFTVGDVETAAASLTVSGGSSNLTLVPLANIVFGGSGASRTVTVTPAAGQAGTATITASVSDGVATTSTTFLLTVVTCTYSLSPSSASVPAIAASGAVALTASAPACAWTAVSHNGFITVTSPASRTGSATVTWNVSATPLTTTRTGTITIAGLTFTITQAAATTGRRIPNDFDHDGLTDLGVFRPMAGRWLIAGQPDTDWGVAGDLPVPGDYNGDGTPDYAVFHPATGTWSIKGGSPIVWGAAGDIPVPGDYDGDGTTDLAIFRPSTGTFYIRGGATIPWGRSGDLPVVGDYDGDGRDDVAVYRPSTGTWYIHDGPTVGFGLAADIPVPADYDGNGMIDIAVFRPSTGTWFVKDQYTQLYGASGDVPVPLDRDGDGRAELGVFRPGIGTWYFKDHSLDFSAVFETVVLGQAGDIPINRAMPPVGARFGDFDGDRRGDLTVFRPSTGDWVSLRSLSGMTDYTVRTFGMSGDVPVGRDYDGDGKSDPAVYRPTDSRWYVLQSSSNFTAYTTRVFGLPGDTPVPADYDGDGLADIAVFRPGKWVVLLSSSGNTSYVQYDWGLSGDIPVPADYDGDGRADIAVFRPSTGRWYVLDRFAGTSTVTDWGLTGDVPAAADFDGDGKADLAVFRPSLGHWVIKSSIDGTYQIVEWGLSGDVLVPADYDGDLKADVAVYRPSTGTWYVRGLFTWVWGLGGDIPALKNP